MNQAANLTASSDLFQIEVCGMWGKESCTGNIPLPPAPYSQPSLLCCLWTVAQSVGVGEEIGKHQTRPFHQLHQVPVPRGASSLMLDPLSFNSRIAEGFPVGTQKQSRSMNCGIGGGELKNELTLAHLTGWCQGLLD